MPSATKRIALVTGANTGIGFEIARQLAERDMTVLIGARDERKGIYARDRLAARNLDIHFVLLDVTDQTTIQTTVGRIKDQFGRLDVLVNNAGILIDAHTRALELSLPLLQNTLETNALGPLLLSQASVPLMRQHNFGRIVNISSTLGSFFDITKPDSTRNNVGSPAYRLSKTLLNAMTVLLAGELEDENILVNAACPGWVRTKLGGNDAPLLPDEAAETPVWLATLPDGGPSGRFFRNREIIPW